jgi:polyphosphate kinase 2 (PPK2 family)
MAASRTESDADNSKMKRKQYEKELRKLQVGLCRLQDWVKHKGVRVIIVFEGRDAAGKGGTIKAITERVSPRVFRVGRVAEPVRPGKNCRCSFSATSSISRRSVMS